MGNTVKFAVGAALAVGIAIPAGAQDTGRLIEEIIVTAQKREERLQDVPISISVVSAETLDAFKLNEATDIQNLVPGVSLTNGAGPRSFGFFIRGIGTTSFSSESIEGSSAYVLDGVVMGQAGASLADLPDVERVEVLRGPQGTLFGKNASAGVISLTTVRPTAEWTARGSAELGEARRRAQGQRLAERADQRQRALPRVCASQPARRLRQQRFRRPQAQRSRRLRRAREARAHADAESVDAVHRRLLEARRRVLHLDHTSDRCGAVGDPRTAADRGRHPLQRDQPGAEHRRRRCSRTPRATALRRSSTTSSAAATR